MKIVMSGSASDKLDWQKHIRSKNRREELAKAFKNPKKPFKIVIVRDMWLTGFDAPSLHTMYVDKPMRGHGLMQAIARVNRVFKDKPGGLVVDYLGLAEELKLALADLKKIAQELVAHVRKSVTIDWTLRESARAQIRVLVRRILRKYGYPPDKQEKATQTVLEQAALICSEVTDIDA